MEEQSQTLEVMLSQSELNQEILAGLMEEDPMESNFNAPINQDTGAIGPNNNNENIIPNVDEGLRHVYIKNSEDTPEKLISHAHPIKRMAELESKIGIYKNCKKCSTGSLLLELFSFEQVQKTLKINKLMNISVRAVLAIDIGTIKGYVHAPDLMDMSTEELKEMWKKQKVLKVDRKILPTKNKSGYTYNASLIVTLKTEKLPHRLPVGDDWVKISKFRKKIIQCHKCNKFYHTAKQCRSDQVCASCGKKHSGDCSSSAKFCTN